MDYLPDDPVESRFLWRLLGPPPHCRGKDGRDEFWPHLPKLCPCLGVPVFTGAEVASRSVGGNG